MTIHEILENHNSQIFTRKGHSIRLKVNLLGFITTDTDEPVSLKASSLMADDWEFVSQFYLGDKVTFGGLSGQVTEIVPSYERSIQVDFHDGSCEWFTADGRLWISHTVPILLKAES